jgi:hypothetical protein
MTTTDRSQDTCSRSTLIPTRLSSNRYPLNSHLPLRAAVGTKLLTWATCNSIEIAGDGEGDGGGSRGLFY